jgi:hypothetical protein
VTEPITPALGAGATPAGSSSGGSGAPASTVTPGTVILPDQLTGQTQTGRYIDPTTGQYDLATTGYAIGMGTVPQLVQLAIFDIDFTVIDVIANDTQSKMTNLLTSALAPFIAQKLLAIVSVNASQIGPNGEGATLRWRDLTTGQEYTSPIG